MTPLRPLRILLALLVAAPALAGCLAEDPGRSETPATPAPAPSGPRQEGAPPAPQPGPAAPAPPSGGGPLAPPAFAAPVEARGKCVDFCMEPSVAVDPLGRVFVATVGGDALAVSEDGGRTFALLPTPPPAPGAAPPPPPPSQTVPEPFAASKVQVLNRSDALVQVAPDGRLYYSHFGGYAQGIQVAASSDGGWTWDFNAYVLPVSDPNAPSPGRLDRQWLGFAPDGTVYLTYSQIPTGIWIARSDDGGKTFRQFVRLAPTEARGTVGQAGPPVVDAQGRVFVPFFTLAAPAEGEAVGKLHVARSEDGGKTFTYLVAHAAGQGQEAGAGFPFAAADEAGGLHVAWAGPTGPASPTGNSAYGLHTATSLDGGATWSKPLRWDAGKGAAPRGPGLVARDGQLHLLWYDLREGESYDLQYGRIRIPDAAAATAAAIARATVAEVASDVTDFGALALLPDGRPVAAWNDGTEAFAATGA